MIWYFWLDTGKASQIKVIRLPSSKIEPEQSYLVMEHNKPILDTLELTNILESILGHQCTLRESITDSALILTSYQKEINVNYRVDAGELLR